jgi:hypothetical protein
MWRLSCMSETWGSDFDYFMKIYSLMTFDAFNGSLVEHCLVYVTGLKLVTYSCIQATRRAKSPKECAMVVTGLTGDRHQSDRCRPVKTFSGWPVTCARVTRYASVCCRVTLWPGDPGLTQLSIKGVIWCQRLWELNTFQLINHLCVVTVGGVFFYTKHVHYTLVWIWLWT